MNRANRFYLLFIATIFALRFWVYVFPLRKIIIGDTLIHHFWIGVILLIPALLLRKKDSILGIILFSISLGIIADELSYILFAGGTNVTQYWSLISFYGMLLVASLVLIYRKNIVLFYKK